MTGAPGEHKRQAFYRPMSMINQPPSFIILANVIFTNLTRGANALQWANPGQ